MIPGLIRYRFILASSALLLTGCGRGVLDPAGPVAASERMILLDSLAIMLALVVPVIVLTLAFAWWFRVGNTRAKYLPDWSYSGQLELLVWSVPLLVVIFVAGIGWVGSHTLDPPRPLASRRPALEIDVVSLDWKWLFVYPEQGIASVNRLVIPVGTPVRFRVTSATVMNSFFVPQLGSQIYAMAGMETQVNLQADRPGNFRGMSAHYSGEGFADMNFQVQAVPAGEFAHWAADARAVGPALDGRAYEQLARLKGNVVPLTFRAVPPRFFDAAVRQAGVPVSESARAGREN